MEALPHLLRAYRVACRSTAGSCICVWVKEYFIPRLSPFLFSRVFNPGCKSLVILCSSEKRKFPELCLHFYILNVEEKYSKRIAKFSMLQARRGQYSFLFFENRQAELDLHSGTWHVHNNKYNMKTSGTQRS